MLYVEITIYYNQKNGTHFAFYLYKIYSSTNSREENPHKHKQISQTSIVFMIVLW